MREIKFRAWNKEEKAFIYNIQDAYDTLGWSEEEGNIGYPCCSFGQFLVEDKFEVMQYTGLKDKNGVEIYEGDVVEDTFNGLCDMETLKPRGTIVFEDGCFCCVYQKNRGSYRLSDRLDYKIEVIGNIHENPELLEDK